MRWQTRKQNLGAAFSLSLCLLPSLILPCQAQSDASRHGQTWALVVGISRYPKLPGGQQLQFADRDATLFATALNKSGIPSQSVRLLTGAEATSNAIRSALGNWIARSASEDDTVILFFSGHGLLESEFGEAYLLAHDSDANLPYGASLSLSELSQLLSRRVRAKRVLIIADAVRRDFFNPDTDGQTASSMFARALEQVARSRAGVTAMLASGPGEFSREGQRWGGNGVFTKNAAEALAGAADQDANGLLTGEEFFTFIARQVAADTSNKQNPWRTESRLADIVLPLRAATPQIAKAEMDKRPPQPAQAKGQPDPVRPSQTPSAGPSAALSTAPPTRTEPRESASQPPAKRDKREARPGETPPKAAAGGQGQPSTQKRADSATPIAKAGAEPVKPRESPTATRGLPQPAQPASPKAPSSETKIAKAAPVSKPTVAPEPAPSAAKGEAREAPRPHPLVLPRTQKVSVPRQAANPVDLSGATIAVASSPPPPKPAPPTTVPVSARPTRHGSEPVKASVAVSEPGPAPSPTVLLLEAAISSGSLTEPKGQSAWDYYQQLNTDPLASAELSRLKPLFADALIKSGRAIVTGDLRADSLADRVDEFRRAGQMFSRARSLAPGDPEIVALEKLSAAEALLALQFYEEAERALLQLQSLRLAAVENALGLARLGALNEWQAERAFRRAIEMAPKWATPHYNLAMLFRGQKKEGAIEEFERAAALEPGNAVTLTLLGDEYFDRQRWQQAADAYRRAIELQPSNEALHMKLGHALYSQGLRDEANREYEKARQLRGKPQ
jgi:tetratricopeptide (TPR) repeat protein/uncharacterized caspase-like protein